MHNHYNHAVLVYSARFGLFNIGDYIQSLAAMQFLDAGACIFVNRERLDTGIREPARIILNGWFMHEPEHWPPAPCFIPLLISFHANASVLDAILSPEGIAYLRTHGPVGCRDHGTLRALRSAGVEAYFSGCLTLTLGDSHGAQPKTRGALFVDPYMEYDRRPGGLFRTFLHALRHPVATDRIAGKREGRRGIRSLRRAAAFLAVYGSVFETELLMTAGYLTHEMREKDFTTEEQKLDRARELLRAYSGASLVVTSRIHCALPCLGMNTRVMYVNNTDQSERSECRLGGIIELFNVIDYTHDALVVRFDHDSPVGLSSAPENGTGHVGLAEALRNACRNFIAGHGAG